MIKLLKMLKTLALLPNIVAPISQWHVIEDLVTNESGISILPTSISEQLNGDVESCYALKMLMYIGN